MSREPGNIVLAPLTITGFSEELCFTSATALINFLQQNGFAKVPTNITNVHVGIDQPTSTQKLDMWVRISASGKLVGLYFYDGTTWRQVFPAPGEVTWIHGDSDDIPEGFSLIDTGLAGWTALEITAIQSMYYPAGAGPWTYFAVQFTGF